MPQPVSPSSSTETISDQYNSKWNNWRARCIFWSSVRSSLDFFLFLKNVHEFQILFNWCTFFFWPAAFSTSPLSWIFFSHCTKICQTWQVLVLWESRCWCKNTISCVWQFLKIQLKKMYAFALQFNTLLSCLLCLDAVLVCPLSCFFLSLNDSLVTVMWLNKQTEKTSLWKWSNIRTGV